VKFKMASLVCLAALCLVSGINAQSVWTARTSGTTTNQLYSVTWTGSQLVAVGFNDSTEGASILTSPDGVTWTTRISGTMTFQLYSVAWTGSQLVAVGQSNSGSPQILTSPDGVAWTTRSSGIIGSENPLYSVVWTGSQLVAVGYNGTAGAGIILTSPDGVTWTSQSAGTATYLTSVVWTGSQLVAVGGNGSGIVITSPDGITWTKQNSGITYGMLSVAWTNSQLVAVGQGGKVFTSADGVTWTSRTNQTPYPLNSVTWTGSQLVAVGGNGVIQTSPDGITWTARNSGTTQSINSAISTGNQIVAVGSAATILISPTTIPSGLSYTLDSVVYSVGNTIVNNQPSVTGIATSYSVTPSLPAGLTLNTTTGIISGKPTSATAASNYVVTASNDVGSTTTSLNITVVSSPALASNPLSQTAILGSQVKFGVSVTVISPLVYTWIHTHGTATDTLRKDTLSSLSDTLVLMNIPLSDTGSYKTMMSNVAGSATSLSAILTINTPPAISIQPHDTTVASGSPASFTVAATGTGTLTYQWQKNGTTLTNGGKIAGATSATLSNSGVAITDTGSYSVIVTNTLNGTTTTTLSNAGRLRVNTAPAIVSNPQNQTDYLGTQAKFGITATGTVPLVYTWLYIQGSTTDQLKKDTVSALTDTLSLVNVSSADASGSYEVSVSNSLGSITSMSTTLTLDPPPSISSQPRDTSVMSSSPVSFTVAASGAGVLSYQWQKNGVNLTNGGTLSGVTFPTLNISAAAVSDTGSYTVIVTGTLNTSTVAATSSPGRLKVNGVGPSAISLNPIQSYAIRSIGSSTLFSLPSGSSSAKITLMDIRGRMVWSQVLGHGVNEVTWNGASEQTSSGLYIARMTLFDIQQHITGVLEKQIIYMP